MEDPQSKSQWSRRDFIKIGAATLAAGAGLSALRPGEKPLSPAAAQVESSIVKTTCALCPSGCGLDVRVVGGKAVKVEGSALHPLNQGVCCLKGQTSIEILYSPERIEHPRIQTGERGSGNWRELSWDSQPRWRSWCRRRECRRLWALSCSRPAS